MWIIENPATGLRPARSRSTYQRALEAKSLCLHSRCEAEDGRRRRGAQRGPRLMGGQREKVSRQSRELPYSIPTALCEEIARAATAELAERMSIPPG